jgi:hypothetical protein
VGLFSGEISGDMVTSLTWPVLFLLVGRWNGMHPSNDDNAE